VRRRVSSNDQRRTKTNTHHNHHKNKKLKQPANEPVSNEQTTNMPIKHGIVEEHYLVTFQRMRHEFASPTKRPRLSTTTTTTTPTTCAVNVLDDDSVLACLTGDNLHDAGGGGLYSPATTRQAAMPRPSIQGSFPDEQPPSQHPTTNIMESLAHSLALLPTTIEVASVPHSTDPMDSCSDSSLLTFWDVLPANNNNSDAYYDHVSDTHRDTAPCRTPGGGERLLMEDDRLQPPPQRSLLTKIVSAESILLRSPYRRGGAGNC
jgi:hypothetical protein